MKKILALILCAVMLASVLVFDASAAGTLVFNDDFTTGFAPRNWITDNQACAYSWDGENQCIYGYSDAVVLQPNFNPPYNKKWDQFYASYDIQVKADDDAEGWEEGDITTVGMWYRDLFSDESGPIYEFVVELQSGKAILRKSASFKYQNENGVMTDGNISSVIASADVDYDFQIGENAEWFELGMRVTSGRIQCYVNQTLVIDAGVNAEDEVLGQFAVNSVDSTVGSQPSPILLLNGGNWIAVDNFEVWSADYDFQDEVLYGDANADGKVTITDASAIMKKVAGWTAEISEKAADANADGKVNLADASLILKYAAGWDVVLGPTE